MRRALVGIVPAEILNRPRKAFLVRSPLTSLKIELPLLLEGLKDMKLSRAGIVDADALRDLLRKASEDGPLPIVHVLRTLLVEAWLTHLATWASISGPSRASTLSQVVFNTPDVARSPSFFS